MSCLTSTTAAIAAATPNTIPTIGSHERLPPIRQLRIPLWQDRRKKPALRRGSAGQSYHLRQRMRHQQKSAQNYPNPSAAATTVLIGPGSILNTLMTPRDIGAKLITGMNAFPIDI